MDFDKMKQWMEMAQNMFKILFIKKGFSRAFYDDIFSVGQQLNILFPVAGQIQQKLELIMGFHNIYRNKMFSCCPTENISS